MDGSNIAVRKAQSIFEELDRLQDNIRGRAYALFGQRGTSGGGPLADWLSAERQLVWKPAIELRRKANQFEILAATPGVEPKDLDVRVTPEDVLIKADIHHKHTPEEGSVETCEFTGGELFRAVHLPESVDPESAKAEYRDGLLRVTASIAKPATRRVEIT
jgi:HSP20 family protein